MSHCFVPCCNTSYSNLKMWNKKHGEKNPSSFGPHTCSIEAAAMIAARRQVMLSWGFFTRPLSTALSPKNYADMCPEQVKAMKEQCFLVDQNDRIIGNASKEECHAVKANRTIPLHRAFSCFLFNSNGDLLIQKRSANKITFPNFYTNTCCSHPILNVAGEDDEDGAIGIKRAAQRRLGHELGIPKEAVPIDHFTYLTRIHYMDVGCGKWGEHEIDYILFVRSDVTVRPNANEVAQIQYVPRAELDRYLSALDGPLTPWFTLVLKHRLKLWWDHLDDLSAFQDHDTIWQLEPCPCSG